MNRIVTSSFRDKRNLIPVIFGLMKKVVMDLRIKVSYDSQKGTSSQESSSSPSITVLNG